LPNINRVSLTRSIALFSLLLAFTTPTLAATPVPFSNTAPITINDNGNAALYPSNQRYRRQHSTRMDVRLNGFTHTFPDDADIILVGHLGKGRF